MSVLTVVSALVCAGLFVGAGLVVSITVQRRFFPAWHGSLAVTVVVLVWLCWALALGQLLGGVGLVRRGALLVAALASAALFIGLSRRPVWAEFDEERRAATELGTASGWQHLALTVGTVLVVLFVAAVWLARTVITLHRGINDPDSLGYHVPLAVTFAHSGYADQHRVLIPILPVQFFPANDELLSAIALALTHSLAFAAAKNLLYGGFVIVAAHALGKAFGAARLTVVAAAIVLGTPVVAFSQPGEAVNDALLLLVLLGGLAVLAHARTRAAPYVLALACTGVALGIKFSGIVPAAALAALAVILMLARLPRRRWRCAGAGLLVSAAMGGSWYVRNAINYANPIPPVKVAIGPLHLHTVRGVDYAISFSVLHYAGRGQLLSVFARGLVRGFGPLIVVTGLLCLWGAIAGVWARDGFRRGLSIVGVVALVGYLVTPAGAYGGPKAVPESFVINLHYAAPALLITLVAGAVAVARWRWAWVLPFVGLVAVATSISRGRGIATWSPEMGGPGFALLLVAVVAGGAVALAHARPALRGFAMPGTAATVALVVVGVAIIAGRYPSRLKTDPLVRWAATVHGDRIAAWNGNIADLYGPQAANKVVIMSQVVDDAALPIETCQAWMSALRDGGFRYAAVIVDSEWAQWMKADPAFRLAVSEVTGATAAELDNFRVGLTVVFQIVGTPNVNCRG